MVFKIVSDVNGVVGNIEFITDTLGIGNGGQIAACGVMFCFFGKKLHGNTNHIVASFFEKSCSDRRIYASAHADKYALFFAHSLGV